MSALGERLLAGLVDGRLHSGEELAAQLDVTRTTIWNLVGELRDKGVDVESVDRRGYRLPGPVELLDAAPMRAAAGALGIALPEDLVVAFEVDSTNTALFDAAPLAGAEPRVLIAELQLAGRGRRGRSWLAPFGSGLTFSIGWSFVDTPPDFPALTLALGVAVVRELHAIGARAVGLKWPNDIVTADGKLGGLLTQARQESGAAAYAVAGLGLNVSLPEHVRARVVESGGVAPIDLGSCVDSPPSRNALAARLVNGLVTAFAEFGRSGFTTFVEDWHEFDRLRGHAVRIEQAHGHRDGIVRGIDRDGALLLESAGAIDRIVAGDVRVRPTPESAA
jgi:BirA family biotin operon repressor/biotin-[acetyl-CoA-carboxylase] ligase